MSKRLARPLLLSSVALALFMAAPLAWAGDCWGCHKYSCMQGFDAGGLFCEETMISCGFIYKLLGIHCEQQTCQTSGACPRSIELPDRSVTPEPEGGDDEKGRGEVAR